MKHILGLSVAILALDGGSAHAQDRLDRSCRREIIGLCGLASDRGAIKTCIKAKASQLSPDCQISLIKRLAARQEGKVTASGGTELRYGSAAKQTLAFYPPVVTNSIHRPALVIFIHGGGWSVGDKASGTGEKAKHFTEIGYAFASLNYRLVPTTDPAGQAEDIAAAIANLRGQAATLGFDPDRIILIGHSAGAHLAALVSSDERYLAKAGVPLSAIRGTVLLDGAGYDVAKQMATGAGPLLGERYTAAFTRDPATQARLSPLTYAASPNVANWLLIHDARRADSGDQSRSFAAGLAKAGANTTVVPIADSNHMKINADLGVAGNFETAKVDVFIKSVL